MLQRFRKRIAPAAAINASEQAATPAGLSTGMSSDVVARLASQASGLGRQAAQLNGLIEDLAREGDAQSNGMRELADQIDQVVGATRDIDYAAEAGRARVDEARTGLQRASGFLRSALAHGLRTRTVPELHFHYDESVERGSRLSQLIDEAVRSDSGQPD